MHHISLSKRKQFIITMIRRVFYEVGYLVNQFVPELYKNELFQEKKDNILSITYENERRWFFSRNVKEKSTEEIGTELKQYKNLKQLEMPGFNGDLNK